MVNLKIKVEFKTKTNLNKGIKSILNKCVNAISYAFARGEAESSLTVLCNLHVHVHVHMRCHQTCLECCFHVTLKSVLFGYRELL